MGSQGLQFVQQMPIDPEGGMSFNLPVAGGCDVEQDASSLSCMPKKLAQRMHHAVCSTLRTVGIGRISNISTQGTNVWTSNECGLHWLDCWNVSPNARVVALSMLTCHVLTRLG